MTACIEETPEILKEAAAAFKALGDPTRLEILYHLYRNPSSVNDLVTHFQITQSAVSQHLRVLRAARLVTYKKQGMFVIYSVVQAKIRNLFEHSFFFAICENPDCCHVVAREIGRDESGHIYCGDNCRRQAVLARLAG